MKAAQAAIAYVRVSTNDQAEHGVSLEAQSARIKQYCELNGITLTAEYVDAGLSGKRADNRPELQAALEHVCKVGGILVVYSLSRLARSTKDTLAIAERLEAAGADLASLSERIDTTSAAGKMVFRMLAVLCEFERDQIAERTSAAMQHKRRRHERVGEVPFGYDLAADGVQLVENAAEQSVLSLINELRGAGESLRAIAAELNRRGVQTKNGRPAWSHSTIQSLVNRKAA